MNKELYEIIYLIQLIFWRWCNLKFQKEIIFQMTILYDLWNKSPKYNYVQHMYMKSKLDVLKPLLCIW